MNVTWVSSFDRICRMSFRPALLPATPLCAHTNTPAGQGILTCAIISSALWTLFLLRCRIQLGFFWLCSVPAWVPEFYDHKSFTSQMDDSNKSRHTHAHTHTWTQAHTTLTWRGVAILSHEHTLLIRNVGHRLPSLPSLWPRWLH